MRKKDKLIHGIGINDADYKAYISDIKSNGMAHAVKTADTKANLTQSVLDNDKGRIVKYAKQLVLLES